MIERILSSENIGRAKEHLLEKHDSYDVGQKRVSRVMKTCRRYLFHVQNSVFEGTITEARLNKLKAELEKKIEKELDSICIYEFDSVKYSRKEQIGAVTTYQSIID